ncbi:MAG TPA: DUF1018 domain-containing protein [Leptospiraceae bacterium]|nr:DUF1018 domain-containing protein [Leptospiraceae bacterium]
MSAIKKEIAKIHVLKKLYQLTEEELYDHVKAWTESDSISKLTRKQAWKVIATLEAKYNPNKPVKTRRYPTIRTSANPNVITLATPEQREYLQNLINQANAAKGYKMTIETMAQRQFKKSEKLLTRNDARILTEAAKSILDRSRK